MATKYIPDAVIANKVENIRISLGDDGTKVKAAAVPDMNAIFQRGVMATCRVTAERFNFTIKLSDLGIVPANDARKDKVLTSIDAVLKNSQRGSLLPKDEMWYMKNGERLRINSPAETERLIRKMFPTRHDGQDTRYIADARYASWKAIPSNGATFIPFDQWDAWYAEFLEAKQGHLDSARLIVANYDRIRAASLRHYSEIALDVYTRLEKTAPEHLSNGNGGQISLLQWLRRWRKFISAAWPTPDEIVRRYTVEERFFWAPQQKKQQLDTSVLDYIKDMDAMDWTGRESARAEWEHERQRLIDQLWLDLEWTTRHIEKSEERMAMMDIAREIQRTESMETHDLAVSYVKAIVERVESVFIGFLETVRNNESAISTTQVNTVLKVTEMIRSMGKGVGSLSQMVEQADLIEQYVADHQDEVRRAQSKQRDVRRNTGKALSELPSIIANATMVIREQAEIAVGHEARRTFFADDQPLAVLDDILSGRTGGTSRRQSANESAIDFADIIPAKPVPGGDEDDLAVVRRSRQSAQIG